MRHSNIAAVRHDHPTISGLVLTDLALPEMDHSDGFNYDLNQFPGSTPGEPSQIFGGAYDVNGQPIAPSLPPGNYFNDLGDGIDENDPKRRRIARVRMSKHSTD